MNLKPSDSGLVCTVQFNFSCWSLPSRSLVLARHTAEGFLDGRNVSCPGYRSLPSPFLIPQGLHGNAVTTVFFIPFPIVMTKYSASTISMDIVCVTWSWGYNQFIMAGKFRQQVLPEAASHINSTVRKQRAMNVSFLLAHFLHLCRPKNGPSHNGYVFHCQIHIMKIIPHKYSPRSISHVILDPIKLAGSHNYHKLNPSSRKDVMPSPAGLWETVHVASPGALSMRKWSAVISNHGWWQIVIYSAFPDMPHWNPPP